MRRCKEAMGSTRELGKLVLFCVELIKVLCVNFSSEKKTRPYTRVPTTDNHFL